MPRGPKKRKPEGVSRQILAENVKALMSRQYRLSGDKPKDLARDAGTSLSTVQRVIGGKTSARTDTIDQLAEALGVLPYQLLIPSLNPANPQVVRGATKEEQELYRRLKADPRRAKT